MSEKKYLSFAVALVGILSFSTLAFADSENIPIQNKLKRGKVISSEYLCSENIKIGNENENVLNSGKKVYTKNASIEKKYKKLNEEENSYQGNINLNVIFEYDKDSYAKVDSQNIIECQESPVWKIRSLPEIHPSRNSCLVSNRYTFYKKSNVGVGEYLLDGHIDILCSKAGEIFVNTDIS